MKKCAMGRILNQIIHIYHPMDRMQKTNVKYAMGRINKNDQWVESILNKQNMQWVEILRIPNFLDMQWVELQFCSLNVQWIDNTKISNG